MQKVLVCFLLISSMIGLSQNDSPVIFEVSAACETTPVESPDDGADDPCIWVPDHNVAGTIIVGTDKKFGLETYDLTGNRINRFGFGNINNVDVNPYFFEPNQDGIVANALVIGTNRSTHSVDFFNLDESGALSLFHREVIGQEMGDIYGLCAFSVGGVHYFVASDKDGTILRASYKEKTKNPLQNAAGKIEKQAIIINETQIFKLSSTVEGLVADTHHKVLYIAEEDLGIWAYPLVDNSEFSPRLIMSTDPDLLVPDIEGLTLYDKGQGDGYLLCSIQGANSYGILDRKSLSLLSVFKIVPSDGIDGAEETDGIDVTSRALPGFPKGLFIVQDGFNDAEKQNFKFVNWADIEFRLQNN
ncbi:MAG: 3-phytase [Gammaproteobacteria bacterium]|jgi:3-phytase